MLRLRELRDMLIGTEPLVGHMPTKDAVLRKLWCGNHYKMIGGISQCYSLVVWWPSNINATSAPEERHDK